MGIAQIAVDPHPPSNRHFFPICGAFYKGVLNHPSKRLPLTPPLNTNCPNRQGCFANIPFQIIYLIYSHQKKQGWAGMTFGSSGTGMGMDNSIPEVREWGLEWTGTGIPAHRYSLFSTGGKTSNSFGSYFGAGHITKSRLTRVRRATGCPKKRGWNVIN